MPRHDVKNVLHGGKHLYSRFYATFNSSIVQPSAVVEQNLVASHLDINRAKACQVGIDGTSQRSAPVSRFPKINTGIRLDHRPIDDRSEEHKSELKSIMR